MRAAAHAASIVAALSLAACGGGGRDAGVGGAGLVEMLEPDLSRVEETVAVELGRLQRDVEQAQEEGVADAMLAARFGELAGRYQAYGFLEAAAAAYDNAGRLQPREVRWAYHLAVLEQLGGRFEAARERLLQVHTRMPDHLPTLLRLGSVELELGLVNEAGERFAAVLEGDPGSAAAHDGLARVALSRSDLELARSRFETALGLQPAATSLHYPLAQVYRRLGDAAAAELHLAQRGDGSVQFDDPWLAELGTGSGAGLRSTRGAMAMAEGRLEIAVAEYRRAVEADPSSLSARLDLGLLLREAGDLGGAARELAAAVRLDGDSALAHQALGTVQAATGDDDGALLSFHRAVELEPHFEAALFHLAATLARLRRFDDAVAVYSRLLERNPQQQTARLGRAVARIDAGDTEQARRELESLARSDPRNGVVHLRLGEALQHLSDLDGARHHYAAALALDLAAADRAAAHLSRGNLFGQERRFAAAVEEYGRALALRPELVAARYNRAGALERLGRSDEAAAEYRTLLEHDPDHRAARFYLAATLFALSRYVEAAAEYEALVRRDPLDEAARLGAVSALSRVGQERQALRRLRQGLAVSPASEALAHALARFLASAADASLRDGAEALQLALTAFDAEKGLEQAETLAMAFAAAGRFDEAVEWQREVVSQARAGRAPAERVARLEANLQRYVEGRACCVAGSP